MNQDNQQNQPEKINLLHQDDIQPDIQKDLPEKPKKTGLSKWVIILITVLVIATIGIGGYFIYNHFFGPCVCINQCGDGKCGEIVCQSIGCPCAETIDSCPEDCKKEEIADPTADWQTYRNEEYGYLFKFPNDFIVQDEHLNDIPMRKWDALGGFAFSLGTMTSRPASIQPIDYKLLKDMGDGVSPASLVCIYKEAGRQLIEENTGSTINLDK